MSTRGLDAKVVVKQQQYHSFFAMPGMGWHYIGINMVYLTLLHVTRSPGPSLPYLHTASTQRLEVGVAWEQGKVPARSFPIIVWCVVVCSLVHSEILSVINYWMSCIWRVVLPFNVQIILISSSFCHMISWIEDMMCWCKFIFSWLFSAKFRYYCMSKPPRGGLQSSPNKLLQYVTAGKAWYIISREKQGWSWMTGHFQWVLSS